MTIWEVSTNYVAGQICYEVYRLKDKNGIDHSGNRETKGLFETREEAQAVADKLNGAADPEA